VPSGLIIITITYVLALFQNLSIKVNRATYTIVKPKRP
jgi:hypothetical protein